jgi:molybdopterin converting factor small subunit
MAIEVRIPTILRTYTGGEKAVDASGATLSELIDDLETRHPGLKDRLMETAAPEGDGQRELRRFVNVYVNDEDVRFTGGLATELSDGDQVVVLPAVAGGSRLGSTG